MRGRSSDQPEPDSAGSARDWRCDVCDQPAHRVIGVAALVGDRLRFWLGGCCVEHEEDVRERRKAETRELGVPEITVTQLLALDEVTGWVQRLQRELTQQT